MQVAQIALYACLQKSYTSGSQLGQARYDTVTGTTKGSRVYMTYDNQKAYPAIPYHIL